MIHESKPPQLRPGHIEIPPNTYANLCVGIGTIFQKPPYSHNQLMFLKGRSIYTYVPQIIAMLLGTRSTDSEKVTLPGLGSQVLEPNVQHKNQFLLSEQYCP